MKKTARKSSTSRIPRLNSLLHRLEKATGQDGESYLDQLMIFLHDPPDDIRDRWKKGAEMCAEWGIACSHASVYRLYRSHAAAWRSRTACEDYADGSRHIDSLDDLSSRMVVQRTCEILSDPDASPRHLISLARLDLQKKALELTRRKLANQLRTPLQRAFSTLEAKSLMNLEAQQAIDALKAALAHPKLHPSLRGIFEFEASQRPPTPPSSPPSPDAPHA